jgi:aminoglycoside phosphotransferase (APT) family kinase protein
VTDVEVKLRDYALREWPGFNWSRAEVRVGAFHTVIIPPTGPILRLTTGNHFDTRAQREARTLQTMARIPLPVPIPHVLAGPVAADDWSATLITRVPGSQADERHHSQPPANPVLCRSAGGTPRRRTTHNARPAAPSHLVRRLTMAESRPAGPCTTSEH